MCRLVAYIGHRVVLEDVLVKPKNSIIMQSLHSRESEVITNGDGFGVGWYAPHIDNKPGIFTSISPAWSDINLLHLSAKIESPCFFAHVRAASAGGVTNFNCHPFSYGKWMLMHNGGIQDFITIKRHIRHLLDDDVYHSIKGDTDSEHLFALFHQLSKNSDLKNINTVGDILIETLRTINGLVKQYGTHGVSYYNICLTDGKRIIATRTCSDNRYKPSSLHYLTQNTLITDSSRPGLNKIKNKSFVLIASEKLSSFNSEWEDIPEHNLMLVENNNIEFVPIN